MYEVEGGDGKDEEIRRPKRALLLKVSRDSSSYCSCEENGVCLSIVSNKPPVPMALDRLGLGAGCIPSLAAAVQGLPRSHIKSRGRTNEGHLGGVLLSPGGVVVVVVVVVAWS